MTRVLVDKGGLSHVILCAGLHKGRLMKRTQTRERIIMEYNTVNFRNYNLLFVQKNLKNLRLSLKNLKIY